MAIPPTIKIMGFLAIRFMNKKIKLGKRKIVKFHESYYVLVPIQIIDSGLINPNKKYQAFLEI
jgi:hypothetical protein